MRKLLGIALRICCGLSLAVAVLLSGFGATQRLGHAALVSQRDASPSMPVSFEVVLKPRNLSELIQRAWATASTRPGHYLSSSQFGRTYGPTDAAEDVVSDYFQDYGLTTSGLWPGRMVMPVAGTVAEASEALDIRFESVHLEGGRPVAVADSYPNLPQSLRALVVGVVGLFANGYFPVTPNAVTAEGVRRGLRTSCGQLHGADSPTSGYSPAAVSRYYHIPHTKLRHPVTVGVAEFASVGPSSPNGVLAGVDRFAHCLGVTPQVSTVGVNGGSDNSGHLDTEEAALDLETLLAYAPQARLIAYTASSGDADALYLRMVSQDRASILLTTWGACEANTPPQQFKIEQLAFAQAALQGQTIIAASGDDGSSDCLASGANRSLAVDDPASQPMVTSVGGEQFSQPLSRIPQPTVWNDAAYQGASGGGLSQVFGEPRYQQRVYRSLGSATRLCRLASGCRLVPDLAMIAVGGEVIVPGTGWTLVGGTSLSASVFAAGIADLESSTAVRLGLLNPWLYHLAARRRGFVSVRLGNNDFHHLHPGRFVTRDGYSLATGLGTPDFAVLLASLRSRIDSGEPVTTWRYDLTPMHLHRPFAGL